MKSKEFSKCILHSAQVQNGIFGVFFFPPHLTKVLLMVSQSVYGMIVSSALWRAKYPGNFVLVAESLKNGSVLFPSYFLSCYIL